MNKTMKETIEIIEREGLEVIRILRQSRRSAIEIRTATGSVLYSVPNGVQRVDGRYAAYTRARCRRILREWHSPAS